MGFWYFLILFFGLFLVVLGLLGRKKFSLVLLGLVCISLSLFMFTPGSADIISDLFNLN